MASKKPTVAVFKFASCDGCQLSLLDAENELLAVADEVNIAYFPEASRKMLKGPYDIGLAEGSVTTPDDVERAREIRKSCRILVTIGACATAGGIQALRNWKDVKEFTKTVYASPEYISTLDRSMPLGSFIHVNYELRGCPINKYQLLDALIAILHKRKPNLPTYSVCVECKLRGNTCLMVAKKTPCLGPVTQAGCNALCPSYQRGCFGCYGPMESPNCPSLSKQYQEMGESENDILLAFRGFNAFAGPFRKESDAHER
ncbi:MAG: oxidoreductase [Bacteroidota bacterium]